MRLRRRGSGKRTCIVFTSDHGHCLGDHYLQGAEHFYDGVLWVPCIVRDPSPLADAARSDVLDDLIESIDLAPTMMEALGVVPSDQFAVQSVLARLRSRPVYRAREQVHFQCDYWPLALRRDPDQCLYWVVPDKGCKYVQFADPAMPLILFDLRTDPDEIDDVAGCPEYAAQVTACCQALLRSRMVSEDQRMARQAASR